MPSQPTTRTGHRPDHSARAQSAGAKPRSPTPPAPPRLAVGLALNKTERSLVSFCFGNSAGLAREHQWNTPGTRHEIRGIYLATFGYISILLFHSFRLGKSKVR